MVEHRDPAFEAAQRALPDNTFDPEFDSYSMTVLAAAREALKPIREWYERESSRLETDARYFAETDMGAELVRVQDAQFLLRGLRKLIYTSEELSGE